MTGKQFVAAPTLIFHDLPLLFAISSSLTDAVVIKPCSLLVFDYARGELRRLRIISLDVANRYINRADTVNFKDVLGP